MELSDTQAAQLGRELLRTASRTSAKQVQELINDGGVILDVAETPDEDAAAIGRRLHEAVQHDRPLRGAAASLSDEEAARFGREVLQTKLIHDGGVILSTGDPTAETAARVGRAALDALIRNAR